MTRRRGHATVSGFAASRNTRESLVRLALLLFLLTVAVCLVSAQQQPDISSQLETARKEEAAGQLQQAESIYSEVLRTHPTADLYQRLGLVRHLQNKFSD